MFVCSELPGGYRDGFQKVIFEEVGPANQPALPDAPSGDHFGAYDDNSVVADNAGERKEASWGVTRGQLQKNLSSSHCPTATKRRPRKRTDCVKKRKRSKRNANDCARARCRRPQHARLLRPLATSCLRPSPTDRRSPFGKRADGRQEENGGISGRRPLRKPSSRNNRNGPSNPRRRPSSNRSNSGRRSSRRPNHRPARSSRRPLNSRRSCLKDRKDSRRSRRDNRRLLPPHSDRRRLRPLRNPLDRPSRRRRSSTGRRSRPSNGRLSLKRPRKHRLVPSIPCLRPLNDPSTRHSLPLPPLPALLRRLRPRPQVCARRPLPSARCGPSDRRPTTSSCPRPRPLLRRRLQQRRRVCRSEICGREVRRRPRNE